MARIPLWHEDDPATPPATRELLRRVGGKRGRILNIYRAMANHPELLERFVDLLKPAYLSRDLPPAQRELAYLAATVANQCFY